jgi:hypothetical protein
MPTGMDGLRNLLGTVSAASMGKDRELSMSARGRAQALLHADADSDAHTGPDAHAPSHSAGAAA